MVDRKAIGSWLEGPAQATRAPDDYPGRRLGLPERGRGSIARFGRRLLALCVDWALCLVVSYGFFGGDQWATLGVFAVENVLLVASAGGTIGHRLMGLRVVRVDGGRATVAQAVGRALLLALALPALVWDRDQRGLHDRFMSTAVLRTRD
ncbi:MAG TPA: RDD family protein [Actinomycetales bacterium]|nr:RDD family protein [Actinomycetales bacterium]